MTGIKQSNFTQVTSVDENDNIPLFTRSENKRITYENMRDQLADEIAVRFIYPTTAQLQQSNLEADEDEPNYVRCEETEYRLYKITALSAGVDDIALDNGMTATYQEEYSKSGFVLGAASSTNNALALFDGTTGTQLKTGAVLSTIGGNLASATSIAQVSYPRVDAANAVTMATPTTLKTDLNLPSNTSASISNIESDISTIESNIVTIEGDIVDINSDLATKVQTVETFAALATTAATTAGMIVYLKQHTSGGLGGGHFQDMSGAVTNDGGTLINNTVTAGRYWKRLADSVNVEQFGAIGYPNDDTASIQAAINAFPQGKKINFTLPKYKYTSTIYLKYQGIFLVGCGVFATNLVYVNEAGGISLKANSDTTVINGAGFSGINFTADVSTGPDVTIDFSGFSYCVFEDFEIYNPRVNAVLMEGYGELGTAPYYNSIDKFRLFGGTDRTQTGMLFRNGAWAGGSRGPNANTITNMMRAGNLKRVIDLKEGQGNIFTNICAESVDDHMIILNDIASYVDNGTATSGANITLTDSSKAWASNAFLNYSVTITGGAGIGQTRKITTNTATVLTVSPAWGVKLDGTSTYAISMLGAFENKFVNVRQEGLASLNPNFITCMAGALGNSLTQASVVSLGSGRANNDLSGHPSNQLSNGRYMMITEVVENAGASANINIWPRISVLGGLGAGESYSIEWMQIKCAGIVSGTATFTLDSGGTTVGGGSPSLVCILDSVLAYDSFAASTDKEARSSLNNGLFLNLTTDASMNSSTDFVVTVCIVIH